MLPSNNKNPIKHKFNQRLLSVDEGVRGDTWNTCKVKRHGYDIFFWTLQENLLRPISLRSVMDTL